MAKLQCDQALDDFKIGTRVEWTYAWGGGWHFDYLKGTVVGFTKHRVQVEFDKGQRFERKTISPTVLKIEVGLSHYGEEI